MRVLFLAYGGQAGRSFARGGRSSPPEPPLLSLAELPSNTRKQQASVQIARPCRARPPAAATFGAAIDSSMLEIMRKPSAANDIDTSRAGRIL